MLFVYGVPTGDGVDGASSSTTCFVLFCHCSVGFLFHLGLCCCCFVGVFKAIDAVVDFVCNFKSFSVLCSSH